MTVMSLRAYANRWAHDFGLSHSEIYGRIRGLVDAGFLAEDQKAGEYSKHKYLSADNWAMVLIAVLAGDSKAMATQRVATVASLPDVSDYMAASDSTSPLRPGGNGDPGSADLRALATDDGNAMTLRDVLAHVLREPRLYGRVEVLRVSRHLDQAGLFLRDGGEGTRAEIIFARRVVVPTTFDAVAAIDGTAFDQFLADLDVYCGPPNA